MGVKLTNEQFLLKVKELVGDIYQPLDEYVNSRTKLRFLHKECGGIFECTPHNFLDVGNRCSVCRYKVQAKKKTRTNKEFLELVKKLPNGDEYEFLEEYVDQNTRILTRHKICGTIFKSLPRSFIHDGCRCPKCIKTSHMEETLLEYAKSICEDVFKASRGLLGIYELDIYVPSKKIAFEYNGLYWHSINRGGSKKKTYHKDKQEYYLRKGIKVYYLWDFQSKEECEKIISDILNTGKTDLRENSCDLNPVSPGENYIKRDPIKQVKIINGRDFIYYDSGYWEQGSVTHRS